MYIITPAIIVNILSILLFATGLFYSFKKPKNKAIFGYSIAGGLIMYIITISMAFVYGLIIKPVLYCFILLLCAISPFAIGKLVKYETLKKYTVVQIICLTVSLAIMLLEF